MLKPINLIKKFVSLNSRDYGLMLNKSVWDDNFKNHINKFKFNKGRDSSQNLKVWVSSGRCNE